MSAVLFFISWAIFFQVEIILANESTGVDICSVLVSDERSEDLAEVYLNLLRELRQVFPEDWSLILDSVVSSDTALNPLSGETVETTGYFQSFDWLVGQDFKWSHVREEAQRWQAELDEEKMREKTDEENARQVTVVEMRLGPSHELTFSPSPRIGPRYYRQPAWIEIGGESFLIFNDDSNRLVSVNVLSGEIRVIRQHESSASQVTTFEYQGRNYAIYGITFLDPYNGAQVSGVEVTDLVSGKPVQLWPGVQTGIPPKRIGLSQDGKPRFLLFGQLGKRKTELFELTFGREGVIDRMAQRGGGEDFPEGVLLQFLSSGRDEYLLMKSFDGKYIVFSYPDLGFITEVENEISNFHTEGAYDLNTPTLYIDAEGNVRAVMGAPVRADLKTTGSEVLEEVEVGTQVLPGLPLNSPSKVSQNRFGSISQPPVILRDKRKLTVLSKCQSWEGPLSGVLYIVDLYSNEVINKVRLENEEVYERFSVRFIEINSQLYLFFVSIDNERSTVLNLISVLDSAEVHRFEFKVSKTRDSDFSIIPTRRGLLAIENRREFGFRSVFLTREVR